MHTVTHSESHVSLVNYETSNMLIGENFPSDSNIYLIIYVYGLFLKSCLLESHDSFSVKNPPDYLTI